MHTFKFYHVDESGAPFQRLLGGDKHIEAGRGLGLPSCNTKFYIFDDVPNEN